MSVTRVRIRAFAFGNFNFFVRHQNGEGEINELDPNHLGDFTFDTLTDTVDDHGVNAEKIRFRGTFGPFTGHFLRHKNFRVLLEKQPPSSAPEFDLFMKDSTFFRRTGLSDVFADQSWSFEATNFPNHFIRHKDLHLFVNTNLSSAQDKRDATFRLEKPT